MMSVARHISNLQTHGGEGVERVRGVSWIDSCRRDWQREYYLLYRSVNKALIVRTLAHANVGNFTIGAIDIQRQQ